MKQNFFTVLLFLSMNAWAGEMEPDGMVYHYPPNYDACFGCSKGVGCIGCCFGGTFKFVDACGEHYGNGTSCQKVCEWGHLWFPTTPQEVYSGEECINAICWTSSISLIGCSLFALGATIWDCRRQ